MMLPPLSGNPRELHLENLPFGDLQRDIQTWLNISRSGAREDSDHYFRGKGIQLTKQS
jgi:hypothetical protein